MKTESVSVAKLKPDPKNVRLHNERNLETIKRSLERFGQQKPIVVDAEGLVVAGNGTLEAARALGWKRIDVVRTPLKGAEAVAFGLADNRTAELASWDEPALAQVLVDLEKGGGIDTLLTGFDDKDIQSLLASSLADMGADADDGESGDGGKKIEDSYAVLVFCGDEADQRDVFEAMKRAGRKCRVLTM